MAKICVPDIGDSSDVTVIEVAVSTGDIVAEGDTLIVLESDKASMEIPAATSGIVGAIHVQEGSEVSEGDPICEVDNASDTSDGKFVAADSTHDKLTSKESASTPPDESSTKVVSIQPVLVPETGNADGITVIEVPVAERGFVTEGDTLIVLESDKASMEIPATASGKVLSLKVSEGDSVVEGDLICELEVQDQPTTPVSVLGADENPLNETAPVKPIIENQIESFVATSQTASESTTYAGPAVRALSRELGVDLNEVPSTGPRGRITKDDLHTYVKNQLSSKGHFANAQSVGIPSIPPVDFELFGPVERVPMTKIHSLTADTMLRCWLNVPAVTQFDQADITELEDFRKSMKAEAEKRGVRLTLMPFLIKAVTHALFELPQVNSSVDPITSEIVKKQYIHVGIAVDTPSGLLVPVIRDADKKGLWELAEEVANLATKAKAKKLKPEEMQGATFTISSLGSIGGTFFTPIVPSPQAAILGISKASINPIWDGTAFQPKLILPMSLSYDHRVINGGDGARFTTTLASVLGDIRYLLL